MVLPKVREIKEALSSFFSRPYTSTFPVGAPDVDPHYRGIPRYHEQYCVGCGSCVQVCPSDAITIVDDTEHRVRKLTIDYGSCMHCGQCEEHCITEKGIQLSTDFAPPAAVKTADELYHSVEKKLVFCESCGAPIACQDHFVWIKERLGAKAYAHPNLLLQTLAQFQTMSVATTKEKLRREDQIKMVCPKCRYRIVTTDEFH